jgi:hypothetical protein
MIPPAVDFDLVQPKGRMIPVGSSTTRNLNQKIIIFD